MAIAETGNLKDAADRLYLSSNKRLPWATSNAFTRMLIVDGVEMAPTTATR